MVFCEVWVDYVFGNINGIKVFMVIWVFVKNGLFIYENESWLNVFIK